MQTIKTLPFSNSKYPVGMGLLSAQLLIYCSRYNYLTLNIQTKYSSSTLPVGLADYIQDDSFIISVNVFLFQYIYNAINKPNAIVNVFWHDI